MNTMTDSIINEHETQQLYAQRPIRKTSKKTTALQVSKKLITQVIEHKIIK
jgi:hypothetical protein